MPSIIKWVINPLATWLRGKFAPAWNHVIVKIEGGNLSQQITSVTQYQT